MSNRLSLAARDPGFVTLTAAAHPLRVSRDVVMVREGGSLADMLREAQPDPILARHAVIFIAGHRIARENWHRVYPKAGSHVEIRVLPAGGGNGQKNIMRTVLMLAVVAVAIAAPYAFPGLAAALGGALGATGAAAGALGGSLITAGVGMVGNLLVNALVPVRSPASLSRSDAPQVFGIEGARNRARAFGTVPQVLGRMRVAPPYGASPYTEIVGSDQYLRCLFVWGVGPLAIDTTSLKIGETPLSEFDGVEIEHREGYDTDAPLTMFPKPIIEDQFQILLADMQDGTGLTGAHVRTTEEDVDEISIDLSWPVGLFDHDNAMQATIRVDYRASGDTTWLAPTFTAMTFPSSWVSGRYVHIEANRQAAVRHGMRWGVPRGQYEVRVTCTSARGADMGASRSYWTALRSITDEDPIQSRVPVAKTVLRIKATDQLSGVVDELTGIVTTKGKNWNGSTWVDDQEITNNASLFRHILQGKANAQPRPDDRVNLPNLEDFHEFCDLHAFTYGDVRESTSTVWDALADCAVAARASPAEIDGKWGVVIDRAQDVAVSHITPRNSSGFRVEKAFIELPHAFRVPFVNAAEDWRRDERRVYRDGYDKNSATLFEELPIRGVTNGDQIFKLGRYRMAQGIHHPERWTFNQDMEFLTYLRGDRAKITHDILSVGLGSGRIGAVVVDAAKAVTAVALDSKITMAAGKDYGLAIRTVPNASLTAQVVTEPGDQWEVRFKTPIPAVGGKPAISEGNLYGFGVLGSATDDAQIISIMPASDFHARITAVPYRAVIYDVDTEVIPPFETNMTPRARLQAPVIESVVSDESALRWGPGETLAVRSMIAIQPPAYREQLDQVRVQVQGRRSATGEPFHAVTVDEASLEQVLISGIGQGETWDYRLRWVADNKLPGPWAVSYNNYIAGKSTPPANMAGLTISAIGGQALMRWELPPELDVRFGGRVVFRHSPVMTGATWQASTSIGNYARAGALVATLPLKGGTYLARIYDSSGNPSPGVATVTTKQATSVGYGPLTSIVEDPAFTGAKTDVVIDSGILKLAPAALSGSYVFGAGIDLGTVQNSRLTVNITAVSSDTSATIDARTDPIDSWEDFDGSMQAEADAIVQVRHTDDDPNASPTWTAWERLDSAEFNARGFQFRALLSSAAPQYNILITDLGITAEQVT